jgi:tetratricopeptide (TPR) repeat protein
MAKKKDTSLQISQEENEMVQSVLQRYHQLADNLRKSSDRQQAEAALTEINAMPESAQMALLAALTKENSIDAADILLAINQFGSLKTVRKEARRSLIRLEGARVYPRWQPPVEQPLPVFEFTSEPARFWKGLVTNTFEAGEVQLMLFWEQGVEYREARLMGFLLDFWGGGVKDFFTEVSSKRHIEEHISEMRAMTKDLDLTECTLAEARRLIEDALAVNKKRGTRPHRDYRMNESLVKQMVLEAPEAGEDRGSSFIAPGLEPGVVVTSFVEALADARYGFAYDLLSSDSTIRGGLSRSDWMARREEWEQAAQPDNFEPGFSAEHEQRSSGLWLPNLLGGNRSTTRKEVEASWSLELTDTALSEGLKELPMPTAIYPETKRHWFWANYVLVQDQGEWRIQDIIDEGARSRLLPVDELQKRIDEQGEEVEEITRKHQPSDPDAQKYYVTILQNTMRTLHYDDALIAKLPLDRDLYEEASSRAIMISDYERALVFLEPMARRFAERRGEALRRVAAAQIQLAEEYFQDEDDERAERFEELAEAALRESLALEDHYLAHIILADLLTEKDVDEDEDEDKVLDEAIEHLHQAQALTTDTETLASIEHKLADIAEEREQDDEAIQHYRRMTEIAPDNADPWLHLGSAYGRQDKFEEAEASYKHALELEPDFIQAYAGLAKLYTENEEDSKAVELIEEGLRKNPDSAQLRAISSSILAASGHYQRAKALLDEAERMNPNLEMLPAYRAILDSYKPQPSLPAKTGQQSQRFGKNKAKKHRKR